MRNIAIFYISEYGGHSKAAANLKEAFRYRNNDFKITALNGFGYLYPRGEKIINFFYTTVIKHFPYLWGKVYDRKKIHKSLNPFRKLISSVNFHKLSQLINRLDAECFIATQAFPCGLIADYKKKTGLKTPLLAVVTDYHPHRFWLHPCIDKYVVACKEAKQVLIREGIAEEKIKVLGIPISVKFLNSYPRIEIALEFNLSVHLPTVLVMGGGLGLGPIKDIVGTLDNLENKFQIIVVCGKNESLQQWFMKTKFSKPVYTFGYIDFVYKFMDFSDIIITKAGGITVSEALAKGLALVVTNPIPGQEEKNVEYLLKKKALVKADTPDNVAQIVKKLLIDKKQMYDLRENAKNNAIIDSSLRIIDLVMGEIGLSK
jgi:processive 1,2-diacylglycerol beta-glucosyltransferase